MGVVPSNMISSKARKSMLAKEADRAEKVAAEAAEHQAEVEDRITAQAAAQVEQLPEPPEATTPADPTGAEQPTDQPPKKQAAKKQAPAKKAATRRQPAKKSTAARPRKA